MGKVAKPAARVYLVQERVRHRPGSGIKNLKGPGRVRDAHDHEAFFRVGRGGAVAVFDVYAGIGKLVGDAGEFARFVAAINENDIIFDGESPMLLENVQGLAVVAGHDADNTMVHRIACGDGVDVDFGFSEGVGKASEGAGAIIQEDRELFGEVHSSRMVTGGE